MCVWLHTCSCAASKAAEAPSDDGLTSRRIYKLKNTIQRFLAARAGKRKLLLIGALSGGVLFTPAFAGASQIIGNLVLSGHTTQVFAVNGTQIDFDFNG